MGAYIFELMLVILIGSFLLDRVLDILNMRNSVSDLPDELSDVYDAEEYKKSQDYKRENTRFSFVSGSFSLLIMVCAIVFGIFGMLDGWLAERVGAYALLVLLFFGILGFISDILGIPFELYDTFVIEEKFGFNRTTKKTFVTDKLKAWLITILLGGGILLLITWLYTATGEYFWLLAWGAITFFSIFMSMFYSNLIVPLFNKQTPLEAGELRSEIEAFANKVGYKLKNIYMIDGSKRSSKANAYFTGLGPKKRIVLYDTLINDLSTEEIVAVLAHEIGHYKRKHTVSGLFLGILQTGVMLYLFSLFVKFPEISEALGAKGASFHIGLIAFAILYSPLSLLLGILTNIFSRRNEYQADKYASDHYKAEYLISALKKLSKSSLSNLTPHKAYVFFHYSHPTLLERMKRMESAGEEKGMKNR